MLLVEATINGTMHRISDEWISTIEHPWKGHIVGFDPVQGQIAYPYGGYVRPGYGSVQFSPDLFASDWPPPVNMTISAYYTATDEASREFLFSGIAHRASITREQIEYDLYGSSFTATVADAAVFSDNLVDIASWFCGASYLNLTLDSTYARATPPDVAFQNSGEQLAVDLFSEICAFFTHCFYISGTTLYLIDMLGDAGSQALTEFQFFPSEYLNEAPVAIAKTTNYKRFSAYPYGGEISMATEFADTQARVEAALDNILTVANAPRARLRVPFIGSLPTPGKRLSWTDTSLGQDLSMWIRARTLTYDFAAEEVIIEGEGALS